MDDGYVAKNFEPFFTTKALAKDWPRAFSTVYGIVQQHKGWIEPEAGRPGHEFPDILAAIEKRKESAPEPVASSTLLLATKPFCWWKTKPDLRTLVKSILQRCGYEVLTPKTVWMRFRFGTNTKEKWIWCLRTCHCPKA